MKQNGKILSIQFLRAIAVLLVAHCHVMDLQIKAPGYAFQSHFFYLQNFGAVGVDIFFVISGFIIAIISAQYASYKQGGYFFLKRFTRIAPLYWLVSILLIAYYLITKKQIAFGSLLKTFIFFPFWDKTNWQDPVISQGWTLSYEMLFYTVVGISLWLAGKSYIKVMLIFFVVTFCLNFLTGNHYQLLIFFGNNIMLEFMMGVAIGIYFQSSLILPLWVANVFVILGAAGLLATLFVGYMNISESVYTINGSLSFMRSLYWGIPSAFLVAGFVMREKIELLYFNNLWMLIGNASFSIYLIHKNCIEIIYARWERWHLQDKVPPDLQAVVSLVLTIIIGCLFYKLIERPLLHVFNKQIDQYRPKVHADVQI